MSFQQEIFLQNRKEKGVVLIITLFVMVILLVYGLVMLNSTADEAGLNSYQIRSTKALFIAEAGLDEMFNLIRNDPVSLISGGFSGTYSPNDFADGNYQVIVSAVTVTSNPPGTEYKVTVTSTGQMVNVSRELKSDVIVTRLPSLLDYSVFAFANFWVRGATGKTFYPPLDPSLPPNDPSGLGKGGDVGSNKIIDFQDAGIQFNNMQDVALYLSLFGDNDPARLGNIMPAGSSANSFVQTNKTSPVNTAEVLHSDCGKTYANKIARLPVAIPKPVINFTPLNNANDGDTFTYNYEGTDYDVVMRVHNGNQTINGNIVWAPEAIHIVKGDLTIKKNSSLTIVDGSLVVQGNLTINNGGQLIITHNTPGKEYRRVLPGVLIYTPDLSAPKGQAVGGTKYIDAGTQAKFTVQGLIYSENYFTAEPQSEVDVTGSIVAGGETGNSFTNWNAQVVIRYDPIVKQTIFIELPPLNVVITRSFWRETH